MTKMLFTLPQDKVRVVPLPNGMYDVTVLDKEEQVEIPPAEEGEIAVTMYQYDGNQFRTVYELTEEEILTDLEKYLNYETSEEPAPEGQHYEAVCTDGETITQSWVLVEDSTVPAGKTLDERVTTLEQNVSGISAAIERGLTT